MTQPTPEERIRYTARQTGKGGSDAARAAALPQPDTTIDSELNKTLNDLVSVDPCRFSNFMDLARIKDEAAQAITNLIAQEANKARLELEEQYNDIFKWLLGENGDFPQSEPGKRYNFRTELRARLAQLTEKGQADE